MARLSELPELVQAREYLVNGGTSFAGWSNMVHLPGCRALAGMDRPTAVYANWRPVKADMVSDVYAAEIRRELSGEPRRTGFCEMCMFGERR